MSSHTSPQPLQHWQTLSSKKIYDNPWISLREDQVINPKGGRGIYGVVSFKNLAIGIVPVDDEGYTYLVGQMRYTLNEYHWEIPEGGGPLHVDPLISAKRELKEETGFEAEHWQYVCKIHTSNSVTDEVGHIFLATGLTAGTAQPDDTELLEVRRIRLADAIQMVMNGEITDSLSMAGLLAVGRLLNV